MIHATSPPPAHGGGLIALPGNNQEIIRTRRRAHPSRQGEVKPRDPIRKTGLLKQIRCYLISWKLRESTVRCERLSAYRHSNNKVVKIPALRNVLAAATKVQRTERVPSITSIRRGNRRAQPTRNFQPKALTGFNNFREDLLDLVLAIDRRPSRGARRAAVDKNLRSLDVRGII